MAGELGLFSAANPVTYATPVQALAAATQGHTSAGSGCEALTPITDPPAELPKARVMRVHEWVQAGHVKLASRFEGAVCDATFYREPAPPGKPTTTASQPPRNIYVDTKYGRLLVRAGDGTLLEQEVPCLQGFGRGEYKVYDLDGVEVCSTFNSAQHLPDPKLGPAQPGLNPFASSGLDAPPGLPGVSGSRSKGFTVAGLSPADIYNAITGRGGNVDLSGVLAGLSLLVAAGGNIGDRLDLIRGGLDSSLAPGLSFLASAVGDLAPGVGSRLALALDGHGQTVAQSVQKTAATAVAAFVPMVGPLFAALSDSAPTVLAKIADVYKDALDKLITAVLRVFRDDIEAKAPVHAGNVDQVAAAALRSALTAGSVAQLSGMALELLHPLKQMGVQQAIGVLAEFAGFSEIAKPYFGATLRYGIGVPAEDRARAHFRTVLPPLADVRRLAASGLVPLDRVHQRAVLAGYPDPYPAAYTEQVYEPISPRALSAFTDGSEADRPWLARKLRYGGVSPDDTDRVVQALELKATQPGRSRVVAALITEYQHGRLEPADLAAGLEGAGLSKTHRDYYLRAAQLERRGYRMELVAGEVTRLYENDQVTRDAAAQMYGAVGFTADEIAVRLTASDLRRGLTQVKQEVAATEAEIRALKAKGLANATRQFRAGFLSRSQFVAVGVSMGYTAALMENSAELALLQGAPTTTKESPAIGLGALQETRAKIGALVASEVQAKRADRVAALAALSAVGLPGDLATTLIDLAEAIAGPAPFAGDYGLPASAQLGPTFAGIAEAVLSGLNGVGQPATLVAELLRSLNIPRHDVDALRSLLGDVEAVFSRS